MALPIDPTLSTVGPEWQIAPVTKPATPAEGSGFGAMLADQVGKLQEVQTDAARASQDLATGVATDPSQVVIAVERARLSMQLASQIRTKAVDAFQDVMRTQV